MPKQLSLKNDRLFDHMHLLPIIFTPTVDVFVSISRILHFFIRVFQLTADACHSLFSKLFCYLLSDSLERTIISERKKGKRLKEGIIISKYTLHSKKHKHPVLVLYWSEIWLCKITKNIREVFLCCRFVIVNVDWITSMTDASYAWWLFDYHQHAYVRFIHTIAYVFEESIPSMTRVVLSFFPIDH